MSKVHVSDPVAGTNIDSESASVQGEGIGQPPVGQPLERHEPPYTLTGFLLSPKFGAAGSGGLEYERLPEAHDAA